MFSKKQIQKVRMFLADKDKKRIHIMLYEMLRCGLQEREFPLYYIAYLLYKPDRTDYLSYIGSRKVWFFKKSKKVHDPEVTQFVRNKLLFHFLYQQVEVAIPQLLGYKVGHRFAFQRRRQTVKTSDELAYALKEGMAEAGVNTIFAKPICGKNGRACFRITTEELENGNETIRVKLNPVMKEGYIFEACICQHATMNQLYPSSVNTIRADTYLDEENNAHVISARLRVGASGSVVDNSSAGGFTVRIDLATGELDPVAGKLLESGAGTLAEHPDTGVVFKGFKIPRFEEVLDTAKTAALALGDPLVGWDIAVGENAPILIEGNDTYALHQQQMFCGGVRKNPVFQKVLDRYGLK